MTEPLELLSLCRTTDLLRGGVMMIDDFGYKGTVLYSTNPMKAEEAMKNKEKLH